MESSRFLDPYVKIKEDIDARFTVLTHRLIQLSAALQVMSNEAWEEKHGKEFDQMKIEAKALNAAMEENAKQSKQETLKWGLKNLPFLNMSETDLRLMVEACCSDPKRN